MGNKSYSKGISWFDDCRIPFNSNDKFDIRRYNEYHDTFSSYEDRGSADGKYEVNEPNKQGRFPANLLVCDDMLNDGNITSQNTGVRKNTGYKTNGWYNGHNDKKPIITQGDKGTTSRYYDIDKWFNNLISE